MKNLDLEKARKEQRGFGHRRLRLVVLYLLTQNPQHGYELIKTIEGLIAGN